MKLNLLKYVSRFRNDDMLLHLVLDCPLSRTAALTRNHYVRWMSRGGNLSAGDWDLPIRNMLFENEYILSLGFPYLSLSLLAEAVVFFLKAQVAGSCFDANVLFHSRARLLSSFVIATLYACSELNIVSWSGFSYLVVLHLKVNIERASPVLRAKYFSHIAEILSGSCLQSSCHCALWA